MKNFITGVEYTGNNAVALACTEFSNPYFMTFRQALSVGRCVKKGEHGIRLCRFVMVEEFKKGIKVKSRKPKYFTVFNVEQTEVVDTDSEGNE